MVIDNKFSDDLID